MSTISIPEILLPHADIETWATIACDQFTSDLAYWRQVERLTAGKKSTFELIFPEIYLKDDPDGRIAKINAAMQKYLSGGVFYSVDGGFILVERTTFSGTRRGIILAIDLEDYSFNPADRARIRSTEATVTERIPPRVKIRKNAPLELPHVMLLYSDPENTVLNSVKRGKTLYEGNLNMDGGSVRGTYIENSGEVIEAFCKLERDNLLFAVGDGNHSLAAAKTCWEELKITLSPEEREVHPARFALAEAVNIFDGALKFEPIFRLVKTDKIKEFEAGFKPFGNRSAYLIIEGKRQKIAFPDSVPEGIAYIDDYIGRFLAKSGGEVDYIHGEKEIDAFASEKNAIGIIVPAIKKEEFFALLNKCGNLPKKTFSMGDGREKRYYIEAKKIR